MISISYGFDLGNHPLWSHHEMPASYPTLPTAVSISVERAATFRPAATFAQALKIARSPLYNGRLKITGGKKIPEFTLNQAFSRRRTHRSFSDQPLPFLVLQRMLWVAQGVTDHNGNRTAPSAHALHPLHLVVTIGQVEGKTSGLYKVGSDSNSLDCMAERDIRGELEDAALDDQPWISNAAGIITICADLAAPSRAFAEQPPFGARGLRYVYIEAGAAAQNVHLQAVAEGLGCVLVGGFRDEATAAVLALEAPIAPILHLCFGWPD